MLSSATCISLNIAFFLSLSSSVFAFPLWEKGAIEASGHMGFTQLNLGNATFGVTETETDSLRQKHNPFGVEFAAGLARVISLNKRTELTPYTWFPELRIGLNLRYLNQGLFNRYTTGQIEQYQEPAMNNYNYRINVESTRLMIDLALTIATIQKVSLFIIGGVGPAWTNLSYFDTPVPGVFDGNLILNDGTKNGFVEEMGIGIFYNCTETIKTSLHYLYTDFGSISTGSTGLLNGLPAQIRPAHFSLHSNAILLGLHLTV